MIRSNDKWLDVFMTQQSLGWAKYFGKLHLKNARLNSSLGLSINDTDLQRILAYNEIRDLSPQDINKENVGLVGKAIEWAQWIPKVDYGRSQRDPKFFEKDYFLCSTCSEKVPVYTATFPDGKVVGSLTEHKKGCRDKFASVSK